MKQRGGSYYPILLIKCDGNMCAKAFVQWLEITMDTIISSDQIVFMRDHHSFITIWMLYFLQYPLR